MFNVVIFSIYLTMSLIKVQTRARKIVMESNSNYLPPSKWSVDLLATSGDMTLSWTSPVYPKLYSNDSSINPLDRPVTSDEDAWIGSLVTIGAMIGPLPFGIISEKFGRKIGLLCVALPHIIAYFTMAFARNIYLFYFSRFLGGLSLGGGYTLIPMYIAEIAHDSNRGMLSQTLNVFWSMGNFIPYAIGPFLSIMWFNIILACVPTTFFIAFFILAPETPYYLASVNKMKKAQESLRLLRKQDEKKIEQEFQCIKNNLHSEGKGHFLDILRSRGLRRAFIICIILVISQEFSGFCAIMFYLQLIFESANTKLASEISALIVGTAIFLSSFFTPFLIDRLGRKLLTIISCFGMFVALTLLGSYFYLQNSTKINTNPIEWLPIFSLIFFIFAFHFGICTIPWTLSSELFPTNVKGISSAAISFHCWFSSFLVTKFFNNMNESMGIAGSFWFFAGCCLATGIFSIFFVPETKGKSFREIQDMLSTL